jgi:DNA-binding CsgD family transcriptional regulator
MTVADEVERIVPAIYDAGVNPAAWQAVLELLVHLLGGHCGSFISRSPDGSGGRCVDVGFDPSALQQFWGYFRGRNVLLHKGLHTPAGAIVSNLDLLPKAEFRQSEYYNDFLMKQEDTNAVLTAFLWRDQDRFVVFNCNRSPSQPEFDASDKELLRPLMAHLGRAVSVALRLGTFGTGAGFGSVVLDSISHGTIVLNETGGVIYANPAAERLLAERDGLTVEQGALRAATPSLTAALHAAIARAAGGADGGAVALARLRRGQPLYALATPLRAENGWLQPARRRVLLLLRDPAERQPLAESDLQVLLRLTAAEARLAMQLYQGEDLAAAAAALGISRHTARAHLNAVLRKTDCRRQGELIRRLVTIAELTAVRAGAAVS